MNILYIAYSCSPTYGSEDKIGWNIPLESAKTNRVWVITKEEHRQSIRAWQRAHPEHPLRFLYADIPGVYKKLFRPPLYSLRLNLWHRRAERIARQLCREERIDLIHQITPIEFRSIGNYGRIPGVKFICGPIAGGQQIPKALYGYLKGTLPMELLRLAMNRLFRWWYGISGKLKQCGCLIFANRETEEYLRPILPEGLRTERIIDISVTDGEAELRVSENRSTGDICRFAVVGRLVCLKGHALLLDALHRIPTQLEYRCVFAGEGPEEKALRQRVKDLGLEERVSFLGNIPYGRIHEVYRQTDVLVMPSFREGSGAVLLEAAVHGIPLVTINRFGGPMVVDENTGWLYDGESREEMMEGLKNALVQCILEPREVRRRGENYRRGAADYTLKEKQLRYQQIYESALETKETEV